MTSHYLIQWWPSLLTHICITRPQWVKHPEVSLFLWYYTQHANIFGSIIPKLHVSLSNSGSKLLTWQLKKLKRKQEFIRCLEIVNERTQNKITQKIRNNIYIMIHHFVQIHNILHDPAGLKIWKTWKYKRQYFFLTCTYIYLIRPCWWNILKFTTCTKIKIQWCDIHKYILISYY